MKKNKLFVFIALLTTVIFFSLAAICNQCGIITPGTTTEAATKKPIEEENESIVQQTTSTITEQETIKETIADTVATATKPTVNIDMIYGPVIEGNLCVQRFKAIITGTPKPTIKWNHDDSNGSFGKDIAQVNLKYGEELDLKVTVTNSAGSASATIHVKYELPTQPSETIKLVSFTFDPKSGPAGTEVKLNLSEPIDTPVTVYYNGQQILWVIFTKTASPDGKTLTVTIPDGASSDYFELKWDGNSVKSSEKFNVTAKTTVQKIIYASAGGTVWSSGQVYIDDASVGESRNEDAGLRGFLSFDIASIPPEAIIQSATLDISNYYVRSGFQDPFGGNPLGFFKVFNQNYGDLDGGDLNNTGILLYEASSWPAPANIDIKATLQSVIISGYKKYQVRLQFETDFYSDGIAYLASFNIPTAKLTVTYQ